MQQIVENTRSVGSRFLKLLNEMAPTKSATKSDKLLLDYHDDDGHPNSPDSGFDPHLEDEAISVGTASTMNTPVKFNYYGNRADDTESRQSFADSGAGSSDDTSSVASNVQTLHCKWEGCQWPGGADDLFDHILVHLPKEGDQLLCKWTECKIYNKHSFKKTKLLEDHCIDRHCGQNRFKCIIEDCGLRFRTLKLREKHVTNHLKIDSSIVAKKKLKLSTDSDSGFSTSSSTTVTATTSASSSNSPSCAGLLEKCCCTCSCHKCFTCTPAYYTTGGRRSDLVDHTHACCIRMNQIKKNPCKKRVFKHLLPQKQDLDHFSGRIAQKISYDFGQKLIRFGGDLTHADVKSGNFGTPLFQERLGVVKFTSRIREEFSVSHPEKHGETITKLRLTWMPDNFIPDTVIDKTDLRNHRSKYVTPREIQREHDKKIGKYANKRPPRVEW